MNAVLKSALEKSAGSWMRDAWRMGQFTPEQVAKFQKLKMLPTYSRVGKGLDKGTRNIFKKHDVGFAEAGVGDIMFGNVKKPKKSFPKGVALNAVASPDNSPTGKWLVLTDPKDAPLASVKHYIPMDDATVKHLMPVVNRHEADEFRAALKAVKRKGVVTEADRYGSHLSPSVLLREAENAVRVPPAAAEKMKAMRSIKGMGAGVGSNRQAMWEQASRSPIYKKYIDALTQHELHVSEELFKKDPNLVHSQAARDVIAAMSPYKKTIPKLKDKLNALVNGSIDLTELGALNQDIPKHKIPAFYRT